MVAVNNHIHTGVQARAEIVHVNVSMQFSQNTNTMTCVSDPLLSQQAAQ